MLSSTVPTLVIDLDDYVHTSQSPGFLDQYSAKENHTKVVLVDEEEPTQYIQTVTAGLRIFLAHVYLEDVQSWLIGYALVEWFRQCHPRREGVLEAIRIIRTRWSTSYKHTAEFISRLQCSR